MAGNVFSFSNIGAPVQPLGAKREAPQDPMALLNGISAKHQVPANVIAAMAEAKGAKSMADLEAIAGSLAGEIGAGKDIGAILRENGGDGAVQRATEYADLLDPAGAQKPKAPEGGPSVAGNAAKMAGYAAVSGLGGASDYIGSSIDRATEATIGPMVRAATGRTDEITLGADGLGAWGAEKLRGFAKDIGPSQEVFDRAADAMPTGNIADPSSWKGPKDFSLEGLTYAAAQGLGSLLPVVATAIATKNPVASMGVGGAMAGGDGRQTAADIIDGMWNEKLEDGTPRLAAESDVFRDLVAKGATPDAAYAEVRTRAMNSAGDIQAIIGGAGGGVTGALVTNGLPKAIAGKTMAGNVARGVAGSALEEGFQEASETAGARYGINEAAGTNLDIGEGTVEAAAAGALAGGPFGALGARRPGQQAAEDQPAALPAPILALPAPNDGGTIFLGGPSDPSKPNPSGDGSAGGQAAAPTSQPGVAPSPGAGAAAEPTAPMGPIQRAASKAPDMTPQQQAPSLFPDMKPGTPIQLVDPETGEVQESAFLGEGPGFVTVRWNGEAIDITPQEFEASRIAAKQAVNEEQTAPTVIAPAPAAPEAPDAPLSPEQAAVMLQTIKDRASQGGWTKGLRKRRDEMQAIVDAARQQSQEAARAEAAAQPDVSPMPVADGTGADDNAAGAQRDPVAGVQAGDAPAGRPALGSLGEGVVDATAAGDRNPAVGQPKPAQAAKVEPAKPQPTAEGVKAGQAAKPAPMAPPGNRIQPDMLGGRPVTEPEMAAKERTKREWGRVLGIAAGGSTSDETLEGRDILIRPGKIVIRAVPGKKTDLDYHLDTDGMDRDMIAARLRGALGELDRVSPLPSMPKPAAAPVSDAAPTATPVAARPEANAPAKKADDQDGNAFITVKDAYGDRHIIRKVDLENPEKMSVRRFNAKGEPIEGQLLAKENIDSDGTKTTETFSTATIIGRKADDGPLKNKAAVRKAITDRGQKVEDFDIREVSGGFIGVRKARNEAPAPKADAGQAPTSLQSEITAAAAAPAGQQQTAKAQLISAFKKSITDGNASEFKRLRGSMVKMLGESATAGIEDQTTSSMEKSAPPIANDRREYLKLQARSLGKQAAIDNDPRQAPEWIAGDDELADLWMAGYGDGIADRQTAQPDKKPAKTAAVEAKTEPETAADKVIAHLTGQIEREKDKARRARADGNSTKAAAHDATLRRLRMNIWKAEEAAKAALDKRDNSLFTPHQADFPIAAEELRRVIGQMAPQSEPAPTAASAASSEPDGSAFEAVGMVRGKAASEDAWFRKQAESGGVATYKVRAVSGGWKLTRDFQPGNNTTMPPTRQLGTVATTADAIAQLRENGMRTGVPEEAGPAPTKATPRTADGWWNALTADQRTTALGEAGFLGRAWADLTSDERVEIYEATAESVQFQSRPATKGTATPATTAAPKPAGGILSVLSDDKQKRGDELKARLAAKARNQVSSGLDPEYITLGAELVGLYIEAGTKRFAQMLRDFAETTGLTMKQAQEPMRAAYNHVRDTMDLNGEDVSDMDDGKAVLDEVRRAMAAEREAEASQSQANGDTISDGAKIEGNGNEQAAGTYPTGQVDEGGEREAGAGRDLESGEPAGNGSNRDLASEPAGSAQGDAGTRRAGGAGARRRGATATEGGSVGAGGVPAIGREDGSLPRTDDAGRLTPKGRANYVISDPEALFGGTPKRRFAKNKAAIEAFQKVTDENREPTSDELDAMAAYIGWGSFGQELFQGTWTRPVYRDGWKDENDWLRTHLGEEEWKAAQNSIINAHYTDPPTVQAMWRMAEQMGFNGGRVLEPSMGIGNFFGMMPPHLAKNSDLTGIELDRLTGGMAKMLYPRANVQIMGYEQSKTPDNFYDLVIGNWPFADFEVPDRRYMKLAPNLHDYFFVKALDQVRPGGIVMGITSAGTMDKQSRVIRTHLAKNAELVGSFRLPTGAFEQYAGTKVVTDLIILRKREAPVLDVSGDGWVGTEKIDTPAGTEIRVNEYYAKNRDKVLGTLNYGSGTTYGRPAMIVDRPADLMNRLERLHEQLPNDGYRPIKRGSEPRFVSNNTTDPQKSIIERDGDLYQIQGDRMVRLDDLVKYTVKDSAVTADRKAQFSALIGIRKKLGEVLDADRDGAQDAETKRSDLKKAYQAFVKKHGAIRSSFAIRVMRKMADPGAAKLMALEGRDGKPAAIMDRATTRAVRGLRNPTVSDAFVLARNESIIFDLDRVAEIAKLSRDEAAAKLIAAKAIYRTPGGGYEPSDVYLSGNVRQKLKDAIAAKDAGEDMDASIEALRSVVPADVPYFNIEAKMGAMWIPGDVYRGYLSERFGLPEGASDSITVRYSAGAWRVDFPAGLDNRAEVQAITGGDVRAKQFISYAMNNQTITIRKKDSEGSEYKDEAASERANQLASELRQNFSEWVWKDPERRSNLESAYNDVMNAVATPSYDGSFMDFAGMSLTRGDSPFNLRSHQANAIWRGVLNGRGIYAHEVGTGKTITMAGLAVESRRYGVARKPLIIAHNANSKSVFNEIQETYPGGKFLYVDNLAPNEISATLNMIATDDWDGVVIPHSLIDRMALKEETLMAMAAEEIAQYEMEALEAAKEDGTALTVDMMEDDEAMKKVRSITAKQLVKARNQIIAKIKKQAIQASKENAVTFEDLGIDMIIVDEAHEFKKPPVATRMTVRGLQKQVSSRSLQLRFLTDYVKGQRGGKGVHVFTGTPITNTLTEIYHQMRYVMDDVMRQSDVNEWDGFFNTFAASVPDVELTSTGEYESVERLAAFVNVAELRRMAGQYMDIVFADDMPEFKPRETASGKTADAKDLTDSERDELLNGRTEKPIGRPYKKVIHDIADMDAIQRDVLMEQIEYARHFKQATGKDRIAIMRRGGPDAPIVFNNVPTRAGLDARLHRIEAQDSPLSKASRAVRNVSKIYKEDPRTTQVIFMDEGYSDASTKAVKNADGEKVGTEKIAKFNLAKDIRDRLIAEGIPADQIAIVDGSVSKDERAEIAQKMNRLEIRVVIGQTSTLGVGVNMQENLRAMHHLDAPWMPGDLEQRNGRGHRQGNKWNTVLEYRYLTEGLDGRRWQVLTIKDRFIKAFLKADANLRVIEGDATDDATSMGADDLAQTLSEAAGDPRILQSQKIDKDIDRLQRRERIHGEGIADAKRSIRRLESMIPQARTRIEKLRRDLAKFETAREAGFTATVNGKTFDDRAEAQEAFDDVVIKMNTRDRDRFGFREWVDTGVSVQGFNIRARRASYDEFYFAIDHEGWNEIDTLGKPSIASVEAGLRRFSALIESGEAQIAQDETSIARLKVASEQPFQQADVLAKKKTQLADLQADMKANPVAPPSWLRQGAPIDSLIYVDGEPRAVTGHRWTDEGWFVMTAEGQVDYTAANDEAGLPIYDAREFQKPEVSEGARLKAGDEADAGSEMRDMGPVSSTSLRPIATEVARAMKAHGLAGKITPRLVRVLLGKSGVPIQGRYRAGEVDIRQDVADPRGVLFHEIIHALRDADLWGKDFGLFKREEWQALVKAVRADKELMARIRNAYPDLAPAKQIEEAVAEMYREWATQRAEATAFARAFNRIRTLFMAMGRALRGEGYVDAAVAMERIASGRVGGRGPQGPGGKRGAGSEMRAFHGTPHVFDRFSLSKIGSGEGAQAFGWGLYFADMKDVARSYREDLTKRKVVLTEGSDGSDTEAEVLDFIAFNFSNAMDEEHPSEISRETIEAWADMLEEDGDTDGANVLRRIDPAKLDFAKGRIMEVEIPEEGDLLDWDAPLSKQPRMVRTRLRNILDVADDTGMTLRDTMRDKWGEADPTGKAIYLSLMMYRGINDREASIALRDAGIPGHRFLDGRSRSPGEGSRNYVIYDDSRIDVVAAEMRAALSQTAAKAKGMIGSANWKDPGEWISNVLTDSLTAGDGKMSILALVPGRALFSELGRNLSSARRFLKAKDAMDALRNEWHAKAAGVMEKWYNAGAKNAEAREAMHDLMHRSTIAGVDPSQPDTWRHALQTAAERDISENGEDGAQDWALAVMEQVAAHKRAYAEVRRMYDALPAEFQKLYVEAKQTLTDLADDMDRAVMDNVQNAIRLSIKRAERAHRKEMERIRDEGMAGAERDEAIAKANEALAKAKKQGGWAAKSKVASMRKQFESNRLKGPYFPLARFGQYFVTVRDENGEVISFSRFEREAQQKTHIKEMEALHPGRVTFGTLEQKGGLRGQVDPRFVADVEKLLRDTGADPDLMDAVWQRYLETLPDLSVRKSKIHRKGRVGWNRDALRAFASHTMHGSHQLARLKYGLELEDALDDAFDEAKKAANPNRTMAIVNEMQRRKDWIMNPQGAAWSAAASSIAFVWYLGVSPAAALVNLSQTTVIGPAVMKARFKGASVTGILSEIARATKDFSRGQGVSWKETWSATNAPGLTADERAALEEGYKRGTIDKTQAHDLAAVAESGVEFNPLREKWMRRIGWAFHHAERVNREVTMLAAYRLARKEGIPHDLAIEAAIDMTWKTHFSYQNSDRPRFMQGDIEKVLFTFRQYTVNLLFRLFRDAHQSLSGATKEERAEAKAQLVGITLSMMAHAGIKGVWGYGLLMMLLGIFFPGGDDDAEKWLQDALLVEGDGLGTAAWNYAMGAVLNGVPGRVLGVDLSERIGSPNLWFRGSDRDLEGEDLLQSYVNETLGPTVGIMFSLARSGQNLAEGDVVRGIEGAVPKFARDIIRTGRYAADGVRTKKGDIVVEDMNPLELLMQANGFTPARVAERYDINSRLKNAEARLVDERSKIQQAAGDGIRSGEGIPADVAENIVRWNREYPEYPITVDTIRQSLRSRMQASERNEAGVSINPKLDRRLRDAEPPMMFN